MTWTYEGDPAANNRDAVRFLLSDTESTDPLLSDEEIAYLLTKHSNDVHLAASEGAEIVARQFARRADTELAEDIRVAFSDRAKQWAAQAQTIAAQASVLGGGTPWAGGLSHDEKDTDLEDTDLVQPAIRRGIHDNPAVASPEGGSGES